MCEALDDTARELGQRWLESRDYWPDVARSIIDHKDGPLVALVVGDEIRRQDPVNFDLLYFAIDAALKRREAE